MRSIIQTAPEELRPEVVGTEIRFRNGSAVVMQGCEDVVKADRLRGPEAHMAIVDEAGFIPVLKYVVESVLMYQLATTDGMMLLTSSPPESPAHQFSVYRTDAMARGAYMHATIHDAPHLTPEAIQNLCNETLGGAKSATWRREALAEFIVDPTKAIVPEFSEQASLDAEREKDPDWLPIVREVERPSHFHAYSVGDLGYVDLTVILFAYWHFELAAIVVEDELVCEKTTSDEIQRRAALIEAKLWNGSGIVGKPERAIDAPRITVADMSRLQEVGSAASPEATEAHQEDWGIAWNQDLHAGVNKLRLDVGYRRFIVHPRCTVLRSHLESGIWNEKKTSFGKSGEMGHFDAVAAAVYLSRTVDRAKNPFPVVRPSHYEQWVRPEAKTSEWGHTRKQRR